MQCPGKPLPGHSNETHFGKFSLAGSTGLHTHYQVVESLVFLAKFFTVPVSERSLVLLDRARSPFPKRSNFSLNVVRHRDDVEYSTGDQLVGVNVEAL